MRTQLTILAAAAMLACGSSFAADTKAPAADAPVSVTIFWPSPPQTPMKRMQDTMERLQATADPVVKQQLLNQHLTALDESVGMLRRMDVTQGRRVEMLEMLLEQMVQHQHIQAGLTPSATTGR